MHYQQHPLSSPRTAQPFLDQKKIWVGKDLEAIRIKEMDAEYLMATMTWLLRRSEELKFQMEMYYAAVGDSAAGPSGEMAQDAFDSGFDQFVKQGPREWMKSTTLFQRMMARYRKLAAFGAPKVQLPLLDVVDRGSY